jgi:hypothetical protein
MGNGWKSDTRAGLGRITHDMRLSDTSKSHAMVLWL